ncbi:MAG: N-carbamoylputrescine amidase [Pseudomonadota bacterium]
MRNVTVAATQMWCNWDLEGNVDRAVALVSHAAAQGANISLIQELFETPYFCKDQDDQHFSLAKPRENHPTLLRFAELAQSLNVVLHFRYFEKSGPAFFNALCVIDADGTILDNYRKSHIPNGPGYQEKQYFSPGDTGFKVWQTMFGMIGVGICWDQWFPEAARIMALKGAELLFYPTAIGSEPHDATIDSKDHWQRTMQGHAAANVTPVIASNRIGVEKGSSCELSFYGSSFIADETGDIVQIADRETQSILLHTFDLDAIAEKRTAWGVFRDRRPELYEALGTLDGTNSG